MITENTLVSASSGIETAELDGEAVLLDINTGLYYGLSSVGARIMALIGEPIQVQNVVDTLLSEYDVEFERLRTDVVAFLQQMQERQLIQTLNGEVA